MYSIIVHSITPDTDDEYAIHINNNTTKDWDTPLIYCGDSDTYTDYEADIPSSWSGDMFHHISLTGPQQHH